MTGKNKIKFKLTDIQIIALGFIGIILLGGILLSLPFASSDNTATPFLNSLFTSTSATCVTGLSVYDTATHWSVFGQVIILFMIQVGGIGFMTVIALFALFTGRNIGLHERTLLMQSAGSMNVGGVVSLVRKIIIGTLLFEGCGAVLLSIRFIPQMGAVGIYYAIFHSVSAFCNAGFDLMGTGQPYSSLSAYADDPLVMITVMALIVLGGLGFLVWSDLVRNKHHFGKYRLHTKVVLITTGVLIFGGAILFFIFESNGLFEGMGTGQRIMSSFFQSITPRTAGFSTIEYTQMSESGNILTTVLMLIGGSPGSTAGGMKITTVAVLLMCAVASSRQNKDITIFKRRLEEGAARQASAVLTIYLTFVIVFAMIICAVEPFSSADVLFETVSAAGTVGLTRGITPLLSGVSKALLMILMYGGRVGGLTLALVLAKKKTIVPIERPTERILIG